jgi:hypothetical protein
MNDHGERLSGLNIQRDIRAIDLSITGSSIRRQLAMHEFRKWDAVPTALARQFVSNGQ